MFDSTSRLTAFGTDRRVSEWAKLPQCQVDEATLLRRLNAGVLPARAITSQFLAEDSEPGEREGEKAQAGVLLTPSKKRGKKHSQYIGVSKRGGVWYAQIRVSRTKVEFIKACKTELEAALAYDARARPLGKKLNFPGGTA